MSLRKTYFVDVILPVPIHKAFTYRVPFEMNDFLKAGIRVVVPFGRSNLQTGIIIKIHEEIPKYQTKYIETVLDDKPIITGKQLKLWYWISDYYMSPIGDVMNASLPANFKLGSETKIVLHPDTEVNTERLSDKEFQIYEALEIHGELDLKEISEILGVKTVQPIIKSLIEQRIIISIEELKEKYKPKTQLFVSLAEQYQSEDKIEKLITKLENNKRKKKQFDVLLLLLQKKVFHQDKVNWVLKKDLINAGASLSSISSLEKDGILQTQNIEISRLKKHDEDLNNFKKLSPEQQSSLDEIQRRFKEKEVVLLHGVTGSGKTEIYVELIKEQLKKNKQVLFLLPEIALTTQLIQRLRTYFGNQIGVYHSRFNQNERIEIWNVLLEKDITKYQIIIGARSSIFLPFRNLGLVIIDEEHESSYKQQHPSPRYNGRDLGIVLATLHKAKVLLGSATPSLESYYNAQQGKFGLVTLNKRFGNIQLPEILIADIKKERKDKTMHDIFSDLMMINIKTALENNEQIILFQNRRGYNPIWMCEICGWNPYCKNCDVSLSYHKNQNVLKCHYCSYYIPPMGTCPKCASNRLKMIGFGTEKIEDELLILLPGVRIQRLDLDTTRQKNSYEKILDDFENRKIDILVGTQMVTKGLDFDNVSLVGVLDADLMLKFPDFRAFERSYQLMSQVAGRAGRKSKRGKVIIQTLNPQHWVIQYVINHDYAGMYNTEIVERKNHNYPPFYKLINITLKHKDANLIEMFAADLADLLKEIFGKRVLGPESPAVKKIQNYYLKVIRLKFEKEASNKKVKELINNKINEFYSYPHNKPVRIVIDIDPM